MNHFVSAEGYFKFLLGTAFSWFKSQFRFLAFLGDFWSNVAEIKSNIESVRAKCGTDE